MPTRYAIEEIQGPDLATFEHYWRQAEAGCAEASLFVRWTWVKPWLQVYGADVAPRLLLLRRRLNDSLAGVVLLGSRRVRRRQVFLVRQLLLNTTGEPDGDSAQVEFNHLLVPTAERPACAAALLLHLSRQRGWDELVLAGVPEAELPPLTATPWLAFGEARRRPSFAMDLRRLRAAGQAPLQALSGNTRSQINRALRCYGGREALTLEAASSATQALAFLEELAELHRRSWETRGQTGSFASERFQRFHQALTREGFPQAVQLLRLRAGGETIGVVYNLVDSGVVYFYQSGLKIPASPKEKPGLCMHLLAMEHNLRLGHDRYDFMASDARYKRSLSNMEQTLVWTTLQRRTPVLLAETAAVSLVRRARQLQAQHFPQAGPKAAPPAEAGEGESG